MKKFNQRTIYFHFLKSGAPVFFCIFISLTSAAQYAHDTTSYIQTVDIKTGKIDTLLSVKGRYEAPNWHRDNFLVVNFNGKIYRLDLGDKKLTEINTGSVNQIMDDHGLSADGKWIAITNYDRNDPSPKLYKFCIYYLNILYIMLIK